MNQHIPSILAQGCGIVQLMSCNLVAQLNDAQAGRRYIITYHGPSNDANSVACIPLLIQERSLLVGTLHE